MTAVLSRSRPTPAPGRRPPGPGLLLVRGSLAHRGLQVLAVLVVVALLLWASSGPLFRMGQLTNVFVLAIAISGLNLVTGYTGLLSIGHSAFFGLGAYTTGVLVVQYGFDAMLTVPIAIGACFVAGLLVGLPSLRIHGLYLALVTLAVGVAFPEIVRRFDDLTGGAAGLVIRARLLTPPEWTGIGRAQRGVWLFWVSAVVLLVVLLLVHNLVRSRAGLAMRAVRDHELAAAAQGVHVARVKILTFGLSAAITGLAGALFAMYVGALAPDGSFTLLKSIELVTGLVLGGSATLLGPVVGAVAVVFLPYLTSLVAPGPVSGIAFGVLLIGLVFVMPEGVVGRLQRSLRGAVTVVDRDHPALVRTAREPGPPEPDGRQPGPSPAADRPGGSPSTDEDTSR